MDRILDQITFLVEYHDERSKNIFSLSTKDLLSFWDIRQIISRFSRVNKNGLQTSQIIHFVPHLTLGKHLPLEPSSGNVPSGLPSQPCISSYSFNGLLDKTPREMFLSNRSSTVAPEPQLRLRRHSPGPERHQRRFEPAVVYEISPLRWSRAA